MSPGPEARVCARAAPPLPALNPHLPVFIPPFPVPAPAKETSQAEAGVQRLLLGGFGGTEAARGQTRRKKSLWSDAPEEERSVPGGRSCCSASQSSAARRRLHSCSSSSCAVIWAHKSRPRGPWMEQPAAVGMDKVSLSVCVSVYCPGCGLPSHLGYIYPGLQGAEQPCVAQ